MAVFRDRITQSVFRDLPTEGLSACDKEIPEHKEEKNTKPQDISHVFTSIRRIS